MLFDVVPGVDREIAAPAQAPEQGHPRGLFPLRFIIIHGTIILFVIIMCLSIIMHSVRHRNLLCNNIIFRPSNMDRNVLVQNVQRHNLLYETPRNLLL